MTRGADKARKILAAEAADDARLKVAAERERTKASATVAEYKRLLRDIELRADMAEELAQHIEATSGAVYTTTTIRAAKARRGALPAATYFALLSDWHVGERVRKSEVGGLNEYNPDIAADRARQCFKSNLVMLRAARSAWNVDTLALLPIGDFITGWIHDEYEAENFLTPHEESNFAYELLEDGILFLLKESDCEKILIATAQGNHGRGTKKPRTAGSYRNSHEYWLYQRLAQRFQGEPRITFQIAQGYYNDINVYGKIVRPSHGDGVKYGGGIGGISVPFNRRIGREAQGASAEVLIYPHGHFHTYDPAANRLGNGSLIGPNAFGIRCGFAPEPAVQASFVVDSRHRVVSNINRIFVERERK